MQATGKNCRSCAGEAALPRIILRNDEDRALAGQFILWPKGSDRLAGKDRGTTPGDRAESLEDTDSPENDDRLMAAIAGGDRRAFERLCHRHLRRSLGVAQRVVVSPHDAEEVVQDAFIQVWQHADRWRPGEARFTTWLYRIVLNRALDYRRRRGFAPLEEAGELPAPQPGAEALVEERQLAAQVDAAIAALPDRQRQALGLCYYGDLSCAEAAGVLNVSVSAMESLLVRARRMVRAKLAPLIDPAAEGETPADPRRGRKS